MGNSPSREPLEPIGHPPEPPWANRAFNAEKYKGRVHWWAEPDYEEHPRLAKYWRYGYYPAKEQDPIWFDPPVEDGTSLRGACGIDSTFRDFSRKTDQSGNFYEYQKKLVKDSHQYKQIAEKFDISEEHPGIKVNPSMATLNHFSYNRIGKDLLLSNSFLHLGPRFWDQPMNEGCLTKGLALAKYAAFFTIPYTFMEVNANPPEFHLKTGYTKLQHYGKRYLLHLPVPCILAFTYGASICACANVRDVDDKKNFWAASAVTGLALYSLKDNVSAGVLFFLVTSLLGTFYHAARTEYRGVQGRVFSQNLEGNSMSSPFTWKFFKGRDREIPDYSKEKF